MLFYRVLELAVAPGRFVTKTLLWTRAQTLFLQSRRGNADIRPAWSELCRTALGGKSL